MKSTVQSFNFYLTDTENDEDHCFRHLLLDPRKICRQTPLDSFDRRYLMKGQIEEVLSKEKERARIDLLELYLEESSVIESNNLLKKKFRFKYHSQNLEIIGESKDLSDPRKFLKLLKDSKRKANANIYAILDQLKEKWKQPNHPFQTVIGFLFNNLLIFIFSHKNKINSLDIFYFLLRILHFL